MRNRRTLSLVVMLVLAFGALAATLASGNKPELGLDLQGGASVVLQPPAGTPKGTVNQAIEIIRNRVDALGVAEPQISRQGNAVVVELPGVKNQKKALEVVGTTAELRFRPVLADLPAEGATTTTTSSTSTTSTTSTTAPGDTASPGETATSTTTTTTPASDVKTTTREENKADATVVLPDKEGTSRLQLGPAALLGKEVKSAKAQVSSLGEWSVALSLRSDGAKKFNELAGICYARQATCPTNRVAIELDGVVQSSPEFQTSSFQGDVTISGNFSQGDAKNLALVLRYGSLPVQLKQQTVRTVSATLGKDSLHAGLVAGIIGTALVLLYMLLYYRILGLVVIAGLTIWFALQWSIISYLGVHNGLALSLSGVTGIVVSVGVTVDSYVVYFERLKDDLHAGRTMRSAIDTAFKHSFRTVLVADTSAFLAAAILYFLTVGSVRGFAFFLGLSTVLDVVVAYFFKRPLVVLLGRWGLLQRSKFVGLRGQVAETARPGLGGTPS
jgi:preprotein translocase subunit SecD